MTASKWVEMPCLAFDTETTGVSVLDDRIITACLVEFPGHGRPRISRYTVDPGIDVPEGASAINGYTRARAIDESTHTPEQMLFEIAGRIALWLGHRKPLVAFNAAFDLSILEAECRRHGIDSLVARLDSPSKVMPVLDPFVLDKHASHRRGSRRLPAVCEFYGIPPFEEHDASGDAVAAGRLWPRVLDRHPAKFRGQTLGGLHAAQVRWRAEQMESLQKYHASQGKADGDYDRSWPLHSSLTSSSIGATA